ncbi:MAG: hypothetical protein JWM33_3836 [Caulobacteraceae bacterium]|nr:hypothetical protein [Caulobacteraceae bacterium]
MGIDIRLPLGALFLVLGLLLVGYGLTADKAVFAVSLGVNIDLIWGVVMAVFGAGALALWAKGRGSGE